MDLAALAAFSSLRDRDLKAEGLVVAEGRLLAERLLAAPGYEALGLICLPGLEEAFGALAAGRCPVQVLSEGRMAELAGFPFHRGVIAAARRPTPPSPEDWLAAAGAGGAGSAAGRAVLVLPRTSDPENLGALLRSAMALGFSAAFLGPGCADPLSRRSLRASMGAALSLPLFPAPDPGLLGLLRDASFSSWAAVLDAKALSLDSWEAPGRLALVLGPEHEGLDEAWKEAASGLLTLPMAPGPDSLNVAAAGAVLMWEWSKASRARPAPRRGPAAEAVPRD
jgi:tRNA G18 (ribose-2'-O)-methylase SpoU